MLRAGQIFAGRYQIERRIAQGGMGVIYAAEHLATEERVALKVLSPHVLGSAATVESFRLEARVTARLGSDHIVRILDAGFDEQLGVPFLVMELLSGMTLQALVDETGPLAPAEALAVLGQVSEALDKAHGYVDRGGRPAPIVHRDLKPENLFVSVREGGHACVKVLDFGIAKVLSASQSLSFEVKGTPLFMACEQFSHGPITPQLDVWALGLIAFSLLAGHHYWLASVQGAEGVAPLLNEILVQPLAPPSERALALGLSPAWPVGFDAWFLRCLDRDPCARFASAGAAVEALVEVFASGAGLTGQAIEAAKAGLARRVALGLASSPKLATTARAGASMLSTVNAAGPPPAASSDVVATRSAGATTVDASNALPEGQGRLASLRARATRVGVVLGVAAALGVVLVARRASRGEVGATSASAASALGWVEAVPSNTPLPSPSALAALAAAPAPAAPAEAPTSARTPGARAPAPARPARARANAPQGAEAVRSKAKGADDAGARVESPPPAVKSAPSRNIYSEL